MRPLWGITLGYVILECCEIRPPAGTAVLPIALGSSVEGGELRKVVEVAKRRLEYWWRRGALRVEWQVGFVISAVKQVNKALETVSLP
ncbi:hypothetical protein HPB52_025378 [Rhipicephalus sanguineus]|uniref:Uncharacterized protein n=1 Tax=Rhipicephalus sanguineus TaxID=34632 RepID=A0A9D4YRK7_RHISA|nr:hypothetical protein HPB52_025378 [Rhipicephalus sanguineus]